MSMIDIDTADKTGPLAIVNMACRFPLSYDFVFKESDQGGKIHMGNMTKYFLNIQNGRSAPGKTRELILLYYLLAHA
jgi:hypothetical protein